MLITNDKSKRLQGVMRRVDIDHDELQKIEMEDARLAHQLKVMNREGDSIKRSGRIDRLNNFNKRFVSKLSRLSTIRQSTGTSSRDDIARQVRKWKEQN